MWIIPQQHVILRGMSFDYISLIPRLLLCACGLLFLNGCSTVERHVSLAAPFKSMVDKNFDIDTMPRYQTDVCLYTAAIEGTPLSDKNCPDIAKTVAAANEDRAKYFRNKIVDTFMGDIDHVYGEYVNTLYGNKGFAGISSDFLTLGLTAASTISLVTRTKTILATLATGVTGLSLSVDKNVFGQQTFAALAIAMQARRDEARSSIIKNEQMSVASYTLQAARRDLISYFYSGTLPGALQEIQEEGAAKSAAVTKTETAATITPATMTPAVSAPRATDGLH